GTCEDDERGPAVHLGSDIEDGKHAERRDGRRDHADLCELVEDGSESYRDLPGRVQEDTALDDEPRREGEGQADGEAGLQASTETSTGSARRYDSQVQHQRERRISNGGTVR